jgi:hypothetical protein
MATNKPSFKIADCPEDISVHWWIEKTLNLSEVFKGLTPSIKPDPFIKFKIKGFDIPEILGAVKEADEQYGWHGFLSHFEDTKDIKKDRAKYYGGFSITHNPDLPYPVNEHASALGEPKINLGTLFKSEFGKQLWLKMEEEKITPKFYQICFDKGLNGVRDWLLEKKIISGSENFDWNQKFIPTKKTIKNSYFDTYNFRYLTQGAQVGALGDFFHNRMQRQMCRSRTAYINGAAWNPNAKDFMWHYDEPIYLNLRINIPLQTTPNYVCEIRDVPGQHHFEVGYAYCWDTTIVHRVYAKRPEPTKRIHLVLGSIPWFDFDEESQTFHANEFFGEMHPFDMVAGGHVVSDIEVVNN